MRETILTYKIKLKPQFTHKTKKRKKSDKHNKKKNKKWYEVRRKINKYIRVARKIAQYSIDNRKDKITTKTVNHLGKIPTTIANQIIRKYKNNFKCKKVTNVNLIIPLAPIERKMKDGTKKIYSNISHEQDVLYLKPLELRLKWFCPIEYTKINQVELNTDYCYITVTTNCVISRFYKNVIGVDVNVKHNLATVGNTDFKEVDYLGKGFVYKRAKYRFMRARYQRQDNLKRIKYMSNKEQRVMRDLNHKVSNKIIELAIQQKADIALEDLTGIREAPNRSKLFRTFLNSWGFYQLRQFIEYKSDWNGIDVFAIDPAYTSQDCSRCGARNKCSGKAYKCKKCGLKIHRDENASYNIADRGYAMRATIYKHGNRVKPDSNVALIRD